MNCIAILGAGGHGKVVADVASQNGWEKIVFLDDMWPNLRHVSIWDVINNTNFPYENFNLSYKFFVGIGDNLIRRKKIYELKAVGLEVVTLIHPKASLSTYACINEGTILMAGTVVNIGVTLGVGVIVNTGATVDHDCKIDEGTHIAPGAHLSGDVQVGSSSMIGVGAVIKPGIKIGSNVIVGAGSVVVSDLPDSVIAYGNPARIVKSAKC